MLSQGIISPSNSAWASSVVLIKKSDGSDRYCCDLRKVNSVTKRDSYPLPTTAESIAYHHDDREDDDWLAQLPVQWEVQDQEKEMRIVGMVSSLRPPSRSSSTWLPPTPPPFSLSPAYSPIEPQIEVIILADSDEDWPDEEDEDQEERGEQEELEVADEVICPIEIVEISDADDGSPRPPSVIVISDDDDNGF